MHRYTIYIIDIAIPYTFTALSIFLFSLSIPDINITNVKYNTIKQNSIIAVLFKLNMLSFNAYAIITNNTPDKISSTKY